MSLRGLMVALLCGLLGLGAGAVVAYAVQPSPVDAGSAVPVPAVSPSIPVDVPTTRPYASDIDYPALLPGISLPVTHQVRNRLATWEYHVPQGWTAYSECPAAPAPCPVPNNSPLTREKVIDRQHQLVFRPADEPFVGGYLIRVAVIDNAFSNVEQTVGTKIIGFQQQQAATGEEFHIIRETTSAVYFTYRALPSNRLRYNYFQWFAVPGHPNATLEMSVAGRKRDVPGLEALFNRFADNVTGH